MVTRLILEQTRRNSDDLAAIKTRLDRVEEKVDGVQRDLTMLSGTVNGFVRKLPTIVGEAVRDAMREK